MIPAKANETLEHVRKVGVQALETARVHTWSEAADPASLVPRAQEGWICTGGGIFLVQDGQVSHISGDGAWAPDQVLSAELLLDDVHSVHLRRLGRDLRAFHYREENEQGEEVLIRTELFVTSQRDRTIRYRTCWHAEERTCNGVAVAVWHPYLSRFAGWSPR